jgi:DNA-binding response OmpR family regulator
VRANICPCCGADITVDTPLIIGDFAMFGEGYPLTYQGRPIRLSTRENSLCWALMKAHPYHLSKDALLNHIGSEEAESNIIEVFKSRIKTKLAGLEIPYPIGIVWGKGLRWLAKVELDP